MGHPASSTPPVTAALEWVTVLESEYEALYGETAFGPGAPSDSEARLRALHLLMHQRRPAALCLSGGGIRSATFGLGVLQALARVGIVGKLDYLSTVSGGGYIGGWLTTWFHRDGRGDALRGLDPAQASAMRGEAARESPVDRLRATCRYLAPKGGLFSADVWTLLATIGRNLFLNWLVLLPLLAAVLLIPRLYLATVAVIEQDVMVPPGQACLSPDAAPLWLLVGSLSMFAVAIVYVVMNFVGRGDRWSQGRFLSFVIVPTVAGATGLTLFWSAYPCQPDERAALALSAVLPAAGWLIIGALSRGFGNRGTTATDRGVRMSAGLRTVTAAFIAGPIIGFGTYWFARRYFDFGDPLGESYAVFGVPAILGLVLLSNATFLGIASRELSDAALEWWNRFAAWIAIAATLWLTAGVLVFYMADLVEAVVQAAGAALRLEHRTVAASVSVLIPFLSSLAGFASRGSGAPGRPSTLRRAVQALALPLVILALLATVAWFNAWALRGFTAPTPGDAAGAEDVLTFGLVLLGVGLLVSRFVPENRFSLNGMYRQRLIRTFLGASHRERQPNAFTGFDPDDDLRIHELKDVRPLQVINATLNNVASTGVGRHERKAYAFTFSPLHVGS